MEKFRLLEKETDHMLRCVIFSLTPLLKKSKTLTIE
jgi:hypothetical protein